MNIIPTDESVQQPISDDQDLAKALAGVLPDVPEDVAASLPPVETVTPEPAPVAAAPTAPIETPATIPQAPTATPTTSGPLDSIKNAALNELRPLLDKVDLPPEEKFDVYLMVIRSTDDPSLIAPAHAVAQTITDEKRHAEALLDIIKEIDYLSHVGEKQAS